MLPIQFTATWPLGLLAALPVVWLGVRRGRTSLSRRRVAVAALLRSLALCLLTVALMRPTLRVHSHDISVVYALDISRSVSPEFVRSALDWMRQTNASYRPAQARYVVFADRAQLVNRLDDIPAVMLTQDEASMAGTNVGDPAGAIDQGATDLEQALLTSMFGFAPGHAKRLVLLTDGNQTEGDLWRALPRVQADQVRVFAVPAAAASANDAWVEALVAPDDVRQQEPVRVKVRVFSRSQTPARVQIRSADRILGTQLTALSPGENELTFQARFPVSGANTITVQVFAEGDQVKRNDTLTQSIWVGPRGKLLYVESAAGSAHYLADALTLQGIDVTVATVDRFAREPGLLDGEDAVVLSDVSADGIGEATGRRLESFVRDQGGGLIFTAGENTYGKQGFANSALERLLPVKFEGRRKRRDLDLVLLIDRSYSMRGHKLELAKSAALASLDLLDEQHRLAVVAFDSKAHDVVPLAEVGSKRRAEDLIGSMSSSGQTNIYVALVHAHQLLKDSHAKSKHIILLSDGVTAPPPDGAAARSQSEEAMELIRKVREDTIRRENGVSEAPEPATVAQGGFAQIAAELLDAKITLSTVTIGDKPNLELMQGLAQWAGGRSYVATAATEIPGMFVAETRRLLGESIVEEPFRPVVRGRSEMLAGVNFAAAPMLKGYVVARPKRFSDVLLDAKNGQPLLAETHYGLGKTVAFLSDVKNRWAADWLSWTGYAEMWAQVVRASMRRDAGEQLGWRVSREGREAVIALTARSPDGTYRNALAPKVRVVTPEGQSTVVVLRQVAPGKYRAHLPLAAPRAAPFRFELLQSPGVSAQELARAGTRSLFYPYSDEYRVLPPNLPLLKALSESTGGKLAPKASEIFADLGDGGVVSKALWQYFATGALLLFLLDIFVRRAPWTFGLER